MYEYRDALLLFTFSHGRAGGGEEPIGDLLGW
jgi:hypothetical protein